MFGVCKDAGCSQSAKGPIELYDGPGRFCPECGEMLQTYEPPPPQAPPPPARPATAPRAPAARVPQRRRLLIAGVACVLAGLALFGVGRLWARDVVGVCASSMGDRVMHDLLQAYAQHPPANGGRYEARTSECGIGFGIQVSTASHAPRGTSVLGNDAIVAIVNPTNPVGQLGIDQLRDIVSGRLTSWSAVGGPARPIAVYMPAEGTDEARVVAQMLLHATPVGSTVTRVPTSAAAVRAVTAASGGNAVALVAFSQAVPGKVVSLAGSPPPSVLSIGNGSYPLAVRVIAVPSDPDRAATGALMNFARSPDALQIAQRDGIVTGR
jgi:hypothetical protein